MCEFANAQRKILHENEFSVRTSHLLDDWVSPSCREGDETQSEQEAGERLDGPAEREHGTAEAATAAQGQQGEGVSDDLKHLQYVRHEN